jgi:hypothetical protein
MSSLFSFQKWLPYIHGAYAAVSIFGPLIKHYYPESTNVAAILDTVETITAAIVEPSDTFNLRLKRRVERLPRRQFQPNSANNNNNIFVVNEEGVCNSCNRCQTHLYQEESKEEKSNNNNSTHEQCAICTCAYEVGEELMKLPCSHEFHVVCIKPWLISKHSCPICRFDISAS